MSEEREVSMGITVMPGKMGGEPCIRGTRIPASMVAELVTDGWSAVRIIEDYESLTFVDVVNAKMWDRKGRPA